MTTPQKAKGSQFERDTAAYLAAHGFPRAERRYGAGNTQDKGDINGVPEVTIECKNVARIDLAGFMAEAERERLNAKNFYGVVIIKRRRRPIQDSYVVMTLDQWTEMLRLSKPEQVPRV